MCTQISGVQRVGTPLHAVVRGALVLSRAVDDPALSEEFLDAVAAQLPGTH